MRRGVAALAVVTWVVFATGCSDDEPESSADAEPTASAATPAESTQPSPTTEPSSPATEDAGQVIEITFEGDSVTPNGDRVEAKAGEPIELRVTADQPGEIHVHSTPEQELEYDAGSSTLELTIDQPGVVEVESHDLEKIIVQLEVTP